MDRACIEALGLIATVTLWGVLGDLTRELGEPTFEVDLPAEATAGDLLVRLAERFGGPFSAAPPAGRDADVPMNLQLFVDGVPRRELARPLAGRGRGAAEVQILVLQSVSGG